MAVTRITGRKWLVKDSVEGAKTTNLAGEGQIAEATVNTFNLVDDAVDATKLDETGDYTINSLVTTATATIGTDLTVTGTANVVGNLSVDTNKFTVDATTGNVVVAGDLTVNGDNVIANTTTLEVEDKNITVAKGGTVATADGSGITVDITDGTAGSLVYDSTSASKFAAGEIGLEDDIVTATVVQTLTNKTVDFINGDSAGATELTVAGTVYQDLEAALVALNSAVGGAAQTLYTDASALVGDDLTVAGAVTIEAVYVSGIRMSLGAANDYTVSGEVVTFIEAPLAGMNIIVSYK